MSCLIFFLAIPILESLSRREQSYPNLQLWHLTKDTLYDYPTNRQGMSSRVSTLLHVDGVTVTFPIEEALQRGINDVPLLLQSM